MPTPQEVLIRNYQKQRDEIEGAYRKAKSLIESQEWTTEMGQLQEEIDRCINAYQIGEPAEKAVALIVLAQRALRRLYAPERVVRDYDELTRKIQEAQQTVGRPLDVSGTER